MGPVILINESDLSIGLLVCFALLCFALLCFVIFIFPRYF